MKKTILTGDRPTGKLHLGHLVGSLQNRIRLQDEFKEYIIIADVQALTDNAENPEKIRDNVLEVAIDNLAVGVDPKKSSIFIQSMIPEIAEMTIYFLNLATLAHLQKNPTVKDEMQQKGFGTNVPMGFLAYPISQAADILAFKADLAPVGADQLPVLEQTNEIVEKFNRIYKKNVFKKIEPMISNVSRLPGIDGKAKMGKSLNNAIYLSDSADEIKKKVMEMYTDPGHIKIGDPGKIEGNVVFAYLDIFDSDKNEIAKLKENYQQGGLGDVEVKKRLIDILENTIAPIREKRKELAKDPNQVMEILKQGTREARAIASQTLKEVKEALLIDYFQN